VHGVFVHAEQRGDLGGGHLPELDQPDGHPLVEPERVPAASWPKVSGSVRPSPAGLVRPLLGSHAPPLGRLGPFQAHEPHAAPVPVLDEMRPQRPSRWVKRLRMAPQVDEDLLHHLLGDPAVAGTAGDEAHHGITVTAKDLLQHRLADAGGARHQLTGQLGVFPASARDHDVSALPGKGRTCYLGAAPA
jgi:hypothetical protein